MLHRRGAVLCAFFKCFALFTSIAGKSLLHARSSPRLDLRNRAPAKTDRRCMPDTTKAKVKGKPRIQEAARQS